MKKTFVLDTNVILSDPNSIFSFEKNEVVIPTVVLQEVDGKKTLMNEIGRNARAFSRELDKIREQGKLHIGVKLDNGGTIRVVPPPSESRIYDNFLDSDADNRIIATAKMIQEMGATKSKVVLVSKDTNVRVKADVEGIEAESYSNDNVINSMEDQYTGFVEVEIGADEMATMLRTREMVQPEDVDQLHENQFVLYKNGTQEFFGINKGGKVEYPYNFMDYDTVFGLQALNIQQKMALEVLLDDSITVVTITSKAGGGKTLLSLAAALQKTLEEGKYKKIAVTRPTVPLSDNQDLGFLPGGIEEKFMPWMKPIYDNLEYLFNATSKADLAKTIAGYEEMIEIEPLAYIRGRSIPYQFIILDEAQNTNRHEMKTAGTRLGHNSKIVAIGDPQQIDHPYIDQYSNGLVYMSEKMKDQKLAAHVTLMKGERSETAEMIAELL